METTILQQKYHAIYEIPIPPNVKTNKLIDNWLLKHYVQ